MTKYKETNNRDGEVREISKAISLAAMLTRFVFVSAHCLMVRSLQNATYPTTALKTPRNAQLENDLIGDSHRTMSRADSRLS
jgi:hypothetical protein